MIRFFADEDFNHKIIQGIRRKLVNVDILTVQDVGLFGSDDRAVIEYASRNGRVVLTHDLKTLVPLAYKVEHSGVVGVPQSPKWLRPVIDDIIVIATCSCDEEFVNLVLRVPF